LPALPIMACRHHHFPQGKSKPSPPLSVSCRGPPAQDRAPKCPASFNCPRPTVDQIVVGATFAAHSVAEPPKSVSISPPPKAFIVGPADQQLSDQDRPPRESAPAEPASCSSPLATSSRVSCRTAVGCIACRCSRQQDRAHPTALGMSLALPPDRSCRPEPVRLSAPLPTQKAYHCRGHRDGIAASSPLPMLSPPPRCQALSCHAPPGRLSFPHQAVYRVVPAKGTMSSFCPRAVLTRSGPFGCPVCRYNLRGM